MTNEICLIWFLLFVLNVLVWQIKGVINYNRQVNAGVRRLAQENRWITASELIKKKVCEKCGKELSESEVHELEGTILCEDCYNEEEDFRGLEEEWF